MKYIFILLLCGVCQAYDPHALDMYCAQHSDGQQYSHLPDLYNCGGFWLCDGDNGAYQSCPLGTLWYQNDTIKTCKHAYEVDCEAQIKEFYQTNAKTMYEKYPGVCNILPTDQEIGDTPEANNTLTISQAVNNDTIMLDTSRPADKPGYLVSFFYRAQGSEDFSFQIWRPVSGKYELIYKTDVSKTLTTGTAAYGQVNVDQPVQVHKGDIIGVMIPAGTNPLYSISKPCTDILYYDIPNSQQPAVHDVLQFAPFTDPDDCVSYSVGALVDTGTDKTASCRRLIASREPQVFYPYTEKESDDTSCWAIRSAGEGNILVVTVNNTIWPTDCITNSLHISEKGPGNTERSILCGSSDAIVTYTTMAYLFIELGANTNYTDMGQDIGIEYYYYRNRASPCYPTNDTFTTDAQTTEQTTEPTTEQTTEQTTEPTTEPTTEQTTFLPTTDSDYQSTNESDDSSEENDTTTASTTSTTSTTASTTTTRSPSTSSTTTTTRRTPDTNVRTTRRTKPPDLSTTTAPTRSSTTTLNNRNATTDSNETAAGYDKQTGDEKLTPAALAGIGVGLLGLLALILIPLIIWLVKRKKKKVYDVNPEDDATSQFSARSDTQLLANGRPPPQINPLIINSANLGPPPNHLPPLKMNPIPPQDGGIGGIGGDPLSSLRTKLPSVRS